MDTFPLLEPEKSPESSRIEHIPPIAKPLKGIAKSLSKSPGKGSLRGGFHEASKPLLCSGNIPEIMRSEATID
jgi:hypothetical protein